LAEPDRYGGYYASCDTACASSDQWTVTKFTQEWVYSEYVVNNEVVEFPALAFTRDGRPRVVSLLYPLTELSEEPYYLAYFACDQECTDAANWQRVKVGERGDSGNYGAYEAARPDAHGGACSCSCIRSGDLVSGGHPIA
jgi:hypothetical protein